MAKTGSTLKTPATPKGILELEFAYNAVKATAVMNSWTDPGQVDNIPAAKLNTWLDFVFLTCYSLFLFHICQLFAASFTGYLYPIGMFLAKGALVAGVLDVLENVGMLVTLHGHVSDGCTLLTFIFSITKWIIALAAVGYAVFAGLLLLRHKLIRYS